MTSTVLVKDALWRVAALLQDQDPQFFRYTERNLVDALNDGQMAIAKFVPSAASRVDAVKLVAGTRQNIASIPALSIKPGDGQAPELTYGTTVLDLVRDMGADGVTPGYAIRRGSRPALDATLPSWHKVVGDICTTWMYDPATPSVFYVSPGLRAARWVEMAYTARPKKIDAGAPGAELHAFAGDSAVTLSMGDEYLDDLVNYVCARMNMATTETGSQGDAGMFASAFLNGLNGLVQARTGSNPNLKKLPFAPEPVGRAAS